MRPVAQLVSVVSHPLLMPTYMLVLLLLVNPYLFGFNALSEKGSFLLIAQVFISTFFIPGFAIMMMKWLKLIGSLQMENKQDRIGPFIATGIFYLWTFQSLYSNSNIPMVFLIAILGATIGLFSCFIINLFFKISLHATGMSGFVGITAITIWLVSYGSFLVHVPFLGAFNVHINLVLIMSILAAGIVGVARLWLSAHTPRELYAGYALGLLSQYVALKVLL